MEIYTDGGCSGNPGPGAWAYVIIKDGEIIVENSAGVPSTTNNRMELSALISALEFITEKAYEGNFTVYTDSQYAEKGIKTWIHNWKANGWRTSDKKQVKNRDLWERLDSLAGTLSINWVWVKGHAGNIWNERCDSLVRQAMGD